MPPLQRVRNFFEATREKYRQEGYLGCLLGGLGQELAGVNELFRARIERCFQEIAERIAVCSEHAIKRGELSRGINPRQLADLLVDCWEGAAPRTRLLRDATPLQAMLDFYFHAMPAQETVRANDLFYWPTGHNVRVVEDAEIVMFSPQREHTHVIDHMREMVSKVSD